MQLVTHRVYVETEEFGIWGTLTFPAVQRLSDALNSAERRFLALTEVTIATKASGERFHHEFLALAVQHVVLAVPVDEPGSLEEGVGLGSRLAFPQVGA